MGKPATEDNPYDKDFKESTTGGSQAGDYTKGGAPFIGKVKDEGTSATSTKTSTRSFTTKYTIGDKGKIETPQEQSTGDTLGK